MFHNLSIIGFKIGNVDIMPSSKLKTDKNSFSCNSFSK